MDTLDYRRFAGWGAALLALLAAALLSVSMLGERAEAAPTSPGDVFEFDGNATVESPPLLDWDDPTVTEDIQSDPTDNTDFGVAAGQKLDFGSADLPWTLDGPTTVTPGKSNLSSGRFFQLIQNEELFAFVAAERPADPGSASVAVVFSQVAGSRLDGDLVLLLGWTGNQQGGEPAAYLWDGAAGEWDTDNPVTSDLALVSSANNTFVEAGVNLTDLALQVPDLQLCPGTSMVEIVTITSHSTGANLVDTINTPFQVDLDNCAELTVKKEVDDDSQWDITVGGDLEGTIGNGGSVGPVEIVPNDTITVTETGNGADNADYTSSVTCVDDDDPQANVDYTPAQNGQSFDIELLPFQSVTCTFVNTLIPPETGDITFVKVVDGGDAAPGDWTFDVEGGPQGIPHNGTETLETGAYTVTEDGPAGYTLTDASGACSLSQGVVTLTVTTDGGTCTITNTRDAGTLRIIKVATDHEGTPINEGTFAFNLGLDDLGTVNGGASDDFNVDTGTYDLTEDGQAGWTDLGGIVVDPGTEVCPSDPQLGSSVEVTVEADETTVVCWYNEKDPPAPTDGTLTITKVTFDAEGQVISEGSFDFNLDGGDLGTVDGGDSNSFPVEQGDYELTEDPEDGWNDLGGFVAGENQCPALLPLEGTETSLDVTITAEETTVVCWYNQQERQEPETGDLLIIKQTLDENGGLIASGSFDFNLDATDLGSVAGGSGETFGPINVGTYDLTEDGQVGWENLGGTLVEPGTEVCPSPQQVSLATTLEVEIASEETTWVCWYNQEVGEEPTPTPTPPPPPPPPPLPPATGTLTLVKQVVNDDGGTAQPDDFTLFVNGQEVQQGVAVQFLAGINLSITEEGPEGYQQVDISERCDDNNLVLQPDEDAVCTITNDDEGAAVLGSSLVIAKVLTSDDPATVGEQVTFRVTLTVTGDTTVTDVGIVDDFDPDHLRFVSSSPAGCVAAPSLAPNGRDAVVCDMGDITPGSPGNPGSETVTVTLTFEAVGSTLPGRTVNNATALVDLDGDGPGGQSTIGPASDDVEIVEVLGLQLPPTGDGSTVAAGGGLLGLPWQVLLALIAAAGAVALGMMAMLPVRSRD